MGALSCYERCLAAAPGNAALHSNCALAHLALAQWEQVLREGCSMLWVRARMWREGCSMLWSLLSNRRGQHTGLQRADAACTLLRLHARDLRTELVGPHIAWHTTCCSACIGNLLFNPAPCCP